MQVEHAVQCAVAGDAAALALLVRRHERMALAVAYAITGDANTAADAAQEGFVRAWQRLAELKEPGRFAAWLCGIVRNCAVGQRRRIRPARPLEAALPQTTPGPLEILAQRELDGRIADALAQLDDLTRLAVVLRYYEDLDSRGIGELIGLSPEAVDMRLSRARRQLRSILSPDEVRYADG